MKFRFRLLTIVSSCVVVPVRPAGSRAAARHRHSVAAALLSPPNPMPLQNDSPWPPPPQTSNRRTPRVARYRQDNSLQIPLLLLPSTYETPGSPTIAELPGPPPALAPGNQCDPPKPSRRNSSHAGGPPSRLPDQSSASSGRPATRPAGWHHSGEQSPPSLIASLSPAGASARHPSWSSFFLPFVLFMSLRGFHGLLRIQFSLQLAAACGPSDRFRFAMCDSTKHSAIRCTRGSLRRGPHRASAQSPS